MDFPWLQYGTFWMILGGSTIDNPDYGDLFFGKVGTAV